MGWWSNQKARHEAKKSGVPLPEGHPARVVQDKGNAYIERKKAEVEAWGERKQAEHDAKKPPPEGEGSIR